MEGGVVCAGKGHLKTQHINARYSLTALLRRHVHMILF